MKSFLYVANWKMQLSYKQAISYAQTYKDQFIALAQQKNSTIILCPSFDALAPITQLFHHAIIQIGAQNCALYSHGPYTGEVSAQSLSEMNVHYCIVGHSERRQHYGETDTHVAQKIHLLLKNNIVPIICIGEDAPSLDSNQIQHILEQQIKPIIDIIGSLQRQSTLCFAYEPRWAIGTGKIPDPAFLQKIFEYLHRAIRTFLDKDQYALLYGGSVDPLNASNIKSIPGIQGLLIGNASLDFQKFQNIVLS